MASQSEPSQKTGVCRTIRSVKSSDRTRRRWSRSTTGTNSYHVANSSLGVRINDGTGQLSKDESAIIATRWIVVFPMLAQAGTERGVNPVHVSTNSVVGQS